jgi:curved DNA-binding protein CbpA
MNTLYELLGALPHDDAESLRAAFRRAVKGAHPDLRPGDPEAALKFRQIVRANEILGDAVQRAVYDNLLELARLEESTASHDIGPRSTRLVSALVALFGASVGTVGFLLLMHMSVAEIGAGHPTRSLDSYDEIIQPGTKGAELDTKVAQGAASGQTTESVMTNVLTGRNLAVGETNSLDAGEISVSGQNDFNGRIADLGQPNRMYLPSYIDHRVIFFRHRKFHGFVDTARTKTPNRAKSAPAITARRIKQAAPWATLARRGAGQNFSRESFAEMAR